MKLFTKIINEKTKEVLIINQEEAKSLGYEEMEVEFSDKNGKAYLKGHIPEKSLEELKQDKIDELKKEREVYKSKTFIREGYSLLDFEPFTCYNYHNLVRLKCGWTQKDLDKFDAENEFISKFWDTKKAEINNATTKTKLKNINTKFVKE